MKDDKQLDHLIGMLYETVLDPSRWKEAIGLCGQYAGGVDAQLVTIDKKLNIPLNFVHAETAFSLQSGFDYANYYITIDPRENVIHDTAVGEWKCCHHSYDQNFVDRNEFYQDFLIPNGVRYAMLAWVDDNENQHSGFGILRGVGQQPFDDTEQLAAQRFSGHLQRALRLQKHTQNLQAKAKLGAMAIDALAMPMLIVDKTATILHLNAAADGLLNQKQGGLVCKMGKLSATTLAQRNKLAGLIISATRYPAVGGGLFLQVGDESSQLFVSPLPAASTFARDFQTPLALVFVVEPGNNLSALHLLGSLYDLSPAELRVASALVNGKSLETCAQEAKVSFNTVRTQLQSVFRKTGTARQPELVALLSQLPQLHR